MAGDCTAIVCPQEGGGTVQQQSGISTVIPACDFCLCYVSCTLNLCSRGLEHETKVDEKNKQTLFI